jgi:hypothetical protein
MRRIKRTELDRLLKNGACEIIFLRRDTKRIHGGQVTRKMVCSNCNEILNSENGLRSLNFHRPRGSKKINEAFHNVIVVWDILKQDYRNVSMEHCFLINEMKPEQFWQFYNETLFPMTPEGKLQYMNSV